MALLLFVSIYSSFNLNINKAVWYLFAGLTVEFLTSWYGYYISYYNTAGVSISILVAIELFFLLISIVLLALAASEILIGNAPAMAYVTTATVFGLIAIIYFCFIYPDGDMINNMRKIFPIAGFAFLMASFWSQSFAPHHGGYLAAALVTTLTTFYLLMRFFGVNYFVEHTWYISALTYVGLSVSLLMMKPAISCAAETLWKTKLKNITAAWKKSSSHRLSRLSSPASATIRFFWPMTMPLSCSG